MIKEGLNIVLVGMMGAGKTFIGEKLSKLVSHFDYIDIDKEIEKEQNLKISDIFEKFSEKYFRELEEKMIEKISKNKNTII
nr:shikimate kinase [bacterium]